MSDATENGNGSASGAAESCAQAKGPTQHLDTVDGKIGAELWKALRNLRHVCEKHWSDFDVDSYEEYLYGPRADALRKAREAELNYEKQVVNEA